MAQPRYRENGEKIRRARKLVSPTLNQTDFAALIGCAFRTVIRLEQGKNLPRPELRDRIVEVSGTDEVIEAWRPYDAWSSPE